MESEFTRVGTVLQSKRFFWTSTATFALQNESIYLFHVGACMVHMYHCTFMLAFMITAVR